MGYAKEVTKKTDKIARDWERSGKAFGAPSADRHARELVRRGKKFVRGR